MAAVHPLFQINNSVIRPVNHSVCGGRPRVAAIAEGWCQLLWAGQVELAVGQGASAGHRLSHDVTTAAAASTAALVAVAPDHLIAFSSA